MSEDRGFPSKKSKILGAVIAVAAVIGVVGWLMNRTDADDFPPPVTTTTTTDPSSSSTGTIDTQTTTTAYKDGSYQAKGAYVSPAGKETVDVSLTIQDGIVTAASFTGNATNPASKAWQENFNKGYQSVVVGKSIDNLALTVVNGASLTPKGFMEAIAQIKQTAQS